MKTIWVLFCGGLVLMGVGGALHLYFAVSPQTIEAQGVLEEEFWALAIGTLSVAVGVFVVSISGMVILAARQYGR